MIPFGSLAHYKTGTKKHNAGDNKFGPSSSKGIFMGYYMHDGSKWSKDFLVLDLEQAIANAEKYCSVLRVAQVYSPQADLYFPMKDHLIQKVVVQAKVTPQDVLKHLAKHNGNCGPLQDVLQQLEKKENPIKAEGTGEDQSSANPDPDEFGLSEIQPSAPREWPKKSTKTKTEEHSETGGVTPSLPSGSSDKPGPGEFWSWQHPNVHPEVAATPEWQDLCVEMRKRTKARLEAEAKARLEAAPTPNEAPKSDPSLPYRISELVSPAKFDPDRLPPG
jgi:hypothetical protein